MHFLAFEFAFALTDNFHCFIAKQPSYGRKGAWLVPWKLLHLVQQTQIIDAVPCGKLNVQVFGPLYKTEKEDRKRERDGEREGEGSEPTIGRWPYDIN